MTEQTTTLKRTLGSFRLWGIAVGLVISGEYFGWSYGWSQAGTLGFMIVALAIAAMYCAFIFSFTELTTAIPHAGGPFAYAYRAFGPTGGFIAGFATLIEFVFAPPAIAMAIGAYLNVQFPALDPKWVACGAYIIFMTLNILGVGIAATFELVVTLLAIFELLVFMGVVAPGFSWSHFTANGWAGAESFSGLALPGMFAAIPFAIWFFLAWRTLANINDPLPQAMKMVVGNSSGWLHMLVWLGLFGLVASFHGIIMGYSRQIYSLARAGYLPASLATLNRRTRTPHLAILAGGVVGIAAIFSDSLITISGMPLTACIVTMSVFGAIVMYITSMAALFKLRRSEPKLIRPFRAPLYPWAPAFALAMAVLCLVAMVWYNPLLALIFAAMMLGGYLWFRKTAAARQRAAVDPQLRTVS
ncbi:MAG: amino acid permease [Klebsiella grimontii]|nr:amino acid permease [Klebsiella grimontii]